jgi:hypothetical protein
MRNNDLRSKAENGGYLSVRQERTMEAGMEREAPQAVRNEMTADNTDAPNGGTADRGRKGGKPDCIPEDVWKKMPEALKTICTPSNSPFFIPLGSKHIAYTPPSKAVNDRRFWGKIVPGISASENKNGIVSVYSGPSPFITATISRHSLSYYDAKTGAELRNKIV